MEATSIIGHTLLMSLLSPISSRMGATSTVVSGSSYFRILAGSQRNLRYGSTDVIGTCEVASKWPPSGLQMAFTCIFFLPVLYLDLDIVADMSDFVMACCTLHNICLAAEEEIEDMISEGHDDNHDICD